MRDLDVGPHGPGDHLVVQRDVGDVFAVQAQRFAHRGGAGIAAFGLHPPHQRVHARVGIAAVVPDAVALRAVARGQQRLEGIERIQRRHAPAQQVDAGVVALDLREEGRQRLRLHAGPHADPRPHRRNRLADLLIVHIAVVRAVERDAEAARVAGFRQQRAGARRVVGQAHILGLGVAIHLGREEGAGHDGLAAHDRAVDRLDVDRVVQRLAHPQILQRVAAAHVAVEQLVAEDVHRQEDGADLRPFEDADIAGLAQPVQVLQRRVEHEIHLTRQQRRDARRIRPDGAIDDLRHIAGRLARLRPAEPVIVPAQHGADIGLTHRHAECAGAVGVADGVHLLPLAGVLRAGRVVPLRPGFRHHEERGEFVRQDRVGDLGHDIHREVVHLLGAVHRVHEDAVVGGRLQRAGDGEDHVIRREGFPFMEADALAQHEAPAVGFHLRPGQREAGAQRQVRVAVDQRVVDLLQHLGDGADILAMRVHRVRIARGRPAHRPRIRIRRRSQAEAKRHEGGRGRQTYTSHAHEPPPAALRVDAPEPHRNVFNIPPGSPAKARRHRGRSPPVRAAPCPAQSFSRV